MSIKTASGSGAASSSGAGLRVAATVERGAFTLQVDLQAPSSRVLAVVGPNGAGKSTLLAAIAGLEPVANGAIAWQGRTWSSRESHVPPRERRVGLLGQDPLLFPHLDALDNIAFGPACRRMRDARQRAERWAERFGVGAFLHLRVGQLSGGQAARVALARTFAASPDLLLLDEPLAALDASAIGELRHLLGEAIREQHLTAVLVSHSVTDVAMLADDVAVLVDGRLTEVGTRDEVLRGPKSAFAAELAGVNLVSARAIGAPGDGLVRFRPSSVTLAGEAPKDSYRWQGQVRWLEQAGGSVRVRLSLPGDDNAEVLVDLDPASVSRTDTQSGVLRPGATVSAHVPIALTTRL